MTAIRLRPGIHYAPIEDGVYFSSARATFVMRGPALLFRVVDLCVPLLEDGTDVDALVEAVGAPSSRPLINHLIDTFDARGLVLPLDGRLGPEPEPEDRARYPETLAYLESFCDRPYSDFRRIRQATVALWGPADAMGPAARGLVRAGVGTIRVATEEPERLAGLAARHPQIGLVPDPATLDALLAGCAPDVAVIMTEDSFPADVLQRLPPACAAVPVRLGKDLAVVGPTLRPGAGGAGPERLWDRAARWSRLDGADVLVRPSGDLLAGALAGQAALDALVGLHPDRVHLVHGPDLMSDAIATSALTEGTEFERAVELGGGRDNRPPGTADWVEAAAARWAGLFRLSVPGDLPQMPLALTLGDGRTRVCDARVVGSGPDQETSTNEAALEVMRRHCAGLARWGPTVGREWPDAGPGAMAPVGAAGRDETRALLDGALRLLAGLAAGVRPMEWLAVDDAGARRLWRTLEEHELTPVRLVSSQVPGFGWNLVSVHDEASGNRLAGGWGPTISVGAVAALSAAIATVQVRRTVDAAYQPPPGGPGYQGHLHDGSLDALAAGVGGWLDATGRRLRGQRIQRDPVLGAIGAWCGVVWLDE